MTLEHGRITSVNYADGVVTCDVQPIRASNSYQSVPVLKQFGGLTVTPKPRMKVLMGKMSDDTRVILGFMTKDSDDEYLAEMDPEELSIRVDSGTRIDLTKNQQGDYDLDIAASGNVFIDGIDFDEHTHSYGDSTISDTSDGSGSESTTTKTTDPPQ